MINIPPTSTLKSTPNQADLKIHFSKIKINNGVFSLNPFKPNCKLKIRLKTLEETKSSVDTIKSNKKTQNLLGTQITPNS